MILFFLFLVEAVCAPAPACILRDEIICMLFYEDFLYYAFSGIISYYYKC